MTLQLAAGDDITVSTTIEVNPADTRWQSWFVDAVTARAQEGARRLRDQLAAQHALPAGGFVPLAAVVPVADVER
ncbi:MAG TPA: hypothetical protein VKW76_13830 [Candidatus Binatia bacterium]|nr:hypothetical protein [Candidatus Binatia bacterium]